MDQFDQAKVVSVLNRLLEAELAGVVRYTHYSFLVFGFGRIPIVSWLREQASESLLHAQEVGEWITTLGDYPSLAIGPLLDSHQHDIAAMLRGSLDTEARALALYRELLSHVEGRSVALEEFARQMIHAEELHAADVDKMLRKPGDVAAFSSKPVLPPAVGSMNGVLAPRRSRSRRDPPQRFGRWTALRNAWAIRACARSSSVHRARVCG